MLKSGKIKVQKPSTTMPVAGWKLYEKDNSTPVKQETKSKDTDQNLWIKNEVFAGNYTFCLYFEDPKNPSFIQDIEIKKHETTIIDTKQ